MSWLWFKGRVATANVECLPDGSLSSSHALLLSPPPLQLSAQVQTLQSENSKLRDIIRSYEDQQRRMAEEIETLKGELPRRWEWAVGMCGQLEGSAPDVRVRAHYGRAAAQIR